MERAESESSDDSGPPVGPPSAQSTPRGAPDPAGLANAFAEAEGLLEQLLGNAFQEDDLCREVDRGDVAKVSRMLDNPAMYSANSSSDYDLRYMSALERAVDSLNVAMVALLFARGADPDNNTYEGSEPTQASYYGLEPVAVRRGFEEAVQTGKPTAGFQGLHALLVAMQDQPGCERMASVLRLLEGRARRSWEPELFSDLPIAFGPAAARCMRSRLRCALLCANRSLPAMSPGFTSKLSAFVMLEDLEVALPALAEMD